MNKRALLYPIFGVIYTPKFGKNYTQIFVAFLPSGHKELKSQDGIESNGEKHSSKVSPSPKKGYCTKKLLFWDSIPPNLGYGLGGQTGIEDQQKVPSKWCV